MREYENSEQIRAMMKKLDKIREEDNDHVDTIWTYSQVVTGKEDRPQSFRESRNTIKYFYSPLSICNRN